MSKLAAPHAQLGTIKLHTALFWKRKHVHQGCASGHTSSSTSPVIYWAYGCRGWAQEDLGQPGCPPSKNNPLCCSLSAIPDMPTLSCLQASFPGLKHLDLGSAFPMAATVTPGPLPLCKFSLFPPPLSPWALAITTLPPGCLPEVQQCSQWRGTDAFSLKISN